MEEPLQRRLNGLLIRIVCMLNALFFFFLSLAPVLQVAKTKQRKKKVCYCVASLPETHNCAALYIYGSFCELIFFFFAKYHPCFIDSLFES